MQHSIRQRREHIVDPVDRDENVDVDIDGAAGALRAPRKSERPAERVRQPTGSECVVQCDDLVGQRTHRRPNIGKRRVLEWRAGNCSARSSTSSSSWPRDSTSTRRRTNETSNSKPAAPRTRSRVSAVGAIRPDSYAASVACDVSARRASARSDQEPRVLPPRSTTSTSTGRWYLIRHQLYRGQPRNGVRRGTIKG